MLPAYTVADWSEKFFNNRALFSDYYLNERLRGLPEWAEDPKPVYRWLRELYAGSPGRFSGKEESFVRNQLLEPVFSALGFEAKGGKTSTSDEVEPDYRLYRIGASGQEASLAICLAYAWGRSLDGKDETRDPQTPEENPSFTVVSLLEKGEAPWAIVTNGKIWRLYSAKAHSRATNYYEIDLEEALASSDPNEFFRYFWLFFRAAAFEPLPVQHEGETRYLSFLDRLLEESEAFAKRLSDRLKERVFEEIFPHFAEGFIQGMGGSAKLLSLPEDQREAALSRCFQGTLTFLYRLLFLLYAESRDLLPVRETRGYWEISLSRLKEEIAKAASSIEDQVPDRIRKAYRAESVALYDRILELCHVVDFGRRELNVPLYNGGLFLTTVVEDDHTDEAENTRFLLSHKIPDRFLALGLDRMARDVDEKRGDLVFIDYKSLGVRQLGSIYEGLLEFKLRIATEKMAVVKGKKTEEVIPYNEAEQNKLTVLTKGRGKDAEERIYSRGEVYLENDRRERKATGSYYTPDYIVKYIVEHTAGPVLEEKFEKLRPKLREAQKTLANERNKAAALRKAIGKSDDPERETYLKHRSLVKEFFDVKVLDPAMGSGHFLVEAVDFITDRMLRFLNAFPWNPIQYELGETRRTILDEMDRQGVIIDQSRLTDVNLLKRHVLKRCIYGVDLNPMAVELAKVSLWLDCFTLGAPLSFLDHHLRCGNSLIGVAVQEVQEAIEWKKGETGNLFGSRLAGLLLATDLMRHVGELSDVTADQVRESRLEYGKATEALLPFKRVLDIYTSQWFGNGDRKKGWSKQSADTDTSALLFIKNREAEAFIKARDEKILKNALEALSPKYRQIAETTLRASAEKHFFHWELEFPEVFYGPRPGTTQVIERLDGAGFDAVIGNPPYDEPSKYYSNTTEADIFFLSEYKLYRNFKNGRLNLYRLFIVRGLEHVRNTGTLTYIVPMALLGDEFSRPTRELLLHQKQLTTIEAFPQKDDPSRRVFPEAKLSTCIVVARNTLPLSQIFVRTHPGRYIEGGSPSYRTASQELAHIFKHHVTIPTVSDKEWMVLKHAFAKTDWPRLHDLAHIYVGEVFDNAPNKKYLSDEPIGPLVLREANVDRYLLRDEPTQGKNRYLRRTLFQKEKQRAAKLNFLNLERIGLQRGAAVDNWRRLIACLVPAGVYCFDTVLLLVPKNIDKLVLLALLNSDLWEWRFRCTSTTNHVNEYELADLIVPPCLCDKSNPEYKKLCTLVDSILQSPQSIVRRSECQEVSSDSIDFQIDNLIFEIYGLGEEDIKIVRRSLSR